MTYLWTEDSGSGCKFWEFMKDELFPQIEVSSKENNQKLLDAVDCMQDNNFYIIAFDRSLDNPFIKDKWIQLKHKVKDRKNVLLLPFICFEQIILQFKNFDAWVQSNKSKTLHIRDVVLKNIKDGYIDFESINDQETLDYISRIKFLTSERLLKSLLSDLTQKRYWDIRKQDFGDCWKISCNSLNICARCSNDIKSISVMSTSKAKALALFNNSPLSEFSKDFDIKMSEGSISKVTAF